MKKAGLIWNIEVDYDSKGDVLYISLENLRKPTTQT